MYSNENTNTLQMYSNTFEYISIKMESIYNKWRNYTKQKTPAITPVTICYFKL